MEIWGHLTICTFLGQTGFAKLFPKSFIFRFHWLFLKEYVSTLTILNPFYLEHSVPFNMYILIFFSSFFISRKLFFSKRYISRILFCFVFYRWGGEELWICNYWISFAAFLYLNFFSNPCNIFKIICLFLPVLSLHCCIDFSLVAE